MRIEGTLKTWNDDRGFGFIAPTPGGQDIFVHIKAFHPRHGRPQVGQLLSFEIEAGPQGRRATRVRARREPSARWVASLLALSAFAVVYIVAAMLWRPPLLLLAAYPVASLVAFVAYAMDKSAARRGAWRTSESTLHLLALVGGWPGALLAQQLLRHKSAKKAFQVVFWCTVILNVAAFVLYCSPTGRALWATWLARYYDLHR